MKSIIKDIAIVLVIVLCITVFIKPIIVKKTSMLPTLQENDYIFLNKQAYRFGEPKRGDIVVFPVGEGSAKELYVKRVIGLPGEEIDISGGTVYINNKALDEDYTNDGFTPGEVSNYKVPKGELYVMGDNRVVSIDSRNPNLGTISIDRVLGKAMLRVYPFNKFGTV